MARTEIKEFDKEFPSLIGKDLNKETISESCFDKLEVVRILNGIKEIIENEFKKHESLKSIIKVKKLINDELENIK